MKRQFRYLFAAAVGAACSTAAYAQTSVTMYGVVDTGIEYVSHAGRNGSEPAYRLSSGNSAGSRWGLRGKEDLGGGMNAIFVLESGFNSDSGTSAQGGRLFGRQVFVGVAGELGQLTLGRQSNPLYDLFAPLDPIRYSTYSILSHDALLAGRTDNAIKYTGKFGNLTVTGLYSAGYDSAIANGSEVPGAPGVGQEIGVGASYTVGNLGMAFAYDQRRGTSVATSGNVERRYATGLIYNGGSLTVQAGYRYLHGGLTTSAMSSNLYWLGGSYAFTPALIVRAGVYRTDRRRSANDAMSYTLQTVYSLSKRTDLYLTGSYLDNRGLSNFGVALGTTAAPGVGQTGVVAGVKHVF